MAAKGHNRKKPAAIKKLEGTYQPCRDGDITHIDGKMTKLPEAPIYLKDSALIFYNEQGNALLKMGLLNEYNLHLFVEVCFYMMLMDIYMEKLIEAEDFDLHRSYKRLFDESHKNYRLALSEFGLTPASANKIRLPGKEKEKDGFEDYI